MTSFLLDLQKMKMACQEWLDPPSLPFRKSNAATAWPKPVRASIVFSHRSENICTLYISFQFFL